MALIYAFTASATNTNVVKRDDRINFNYMMSAVGIIGYTWVQGAEQMREVMTHCTGCREGQMWYNADCVYHSLKVASGTTLFCILFGAPELVTARVPAVFHRYLTTIK
jgi:hypothetical protein